MPTPPNVFSMKLKRLPRPSVNCKSWREESLKNHKSLIFESVFFSDEKVDFVCRAKQQGYFIRLFFVATSHPSINAARIAKRVIQGGDDSQIAEHMSNSKIEQPSKELLAAIKEGEKLASEPKAKTYSVPQELWDELGI